jgi:hypothetical protein
MDPEQALYVWLLFHVGILLQILLQARASIAARSNSIGSFRVWWEHNHRELGLRLFIDGALWMGWMVGPHFLGEAAAHLIPPVSYAVAPWIGFSADRFSHSCGFILRFTTVDMGIVAPAEANRKTDDAAAPDLSARPPD